MELVIILRFRYSSKCFAIKDCVDLFDHRLRLTFSSKSRYRFSIVRNHGIHQDITVRMKNATVNDHQNSENNTRSYLPGQA